MVANNLQVERLVYEFAVTPEVKALLTDAERISYLGSATDRLVSMLPDLLARERAAVITQLMEELERRSSTVEAASSDVRLTLQAGTDTARAVQETLATLDRLAVRYAQSRPAKAGKPGEPFDVQQYVDLLHGANATASEFGELAGRIERVLPQSAAAARTPRPAYRL